MVKWCILQKYISRPLLLSHSVPRRHIGSEMYLKPSRPRRPQRFQTEVLLCFTGANQLCNGVKWFLLFPTKTESSKPDGEFSPEQYSIWRFKNKLGPGQE